ncbi:SLN13 protein, partial [Pluvianellus socialis]|nr:SLN13 protein [Pluvianellus socialis]
QQQQEVWVNLETKYPEVVLCVGKICFGEKARKRMPKNSKQDQRCTLARAVCALLNSGGGIIQAEIENENYNLKRQKIGLDLEEAFRSLLLFPDWGKYLDFKQQDNYLLIFVKTWSSENTSLNPRSAKPRICSVSTALYIKSGASLCQVSPSEVFLYLKEKKDEDTGQLSPEPPPKTKKTMPVEGDMAVINDTVAEFFNRDQLQHGEMLPFAESETVEFKHYSTEKFLTRVKETLPEYITGFANARGGYLWIGVDDDGIVQGFSRDEDLEKLNHVIYSVRNKLTLFHSCEHAHTHNVRYKHKIFKVYGEAGDHCGYVCAVKIQPLTRIAFSEIHSVTCIAFFKDPDSWLVEGSTIRKLGAVEWVKWMTAADPDLSKFSETFRLALSVTERPPLAKPVYSHLGLDNVDDLCKQLFPVKSHSIIFAPEKLSKDLVQKHPGLDILMQNQLNQLSEGVLIFSRSWAVEVGLPENQTIICDVLLIAKDRPPILYTICNCCISEDLFEYSRCIARTLKEKLVNTGGYIHKLCVIPKVLTLHPQTNPGKEWDLNIQEMYPQNYSLINSGNLKALLHALTVVLLSFKSFLSDYVGSEVLNLLTIKQYQLLSENLHKTKKLYIYGLPGTGKTVVALKIIEKISSMLKCKQEEILYICENKPLRDFVRQKNICQAVTRVGFLKGRFNDVKHVIIDEAQNFQDGEGDWYGKASALTSSRHLPEPGFFWIFLDYLQTSHCFPTGLPELNWHDPIESLTKVVRNANSIYRFLKYNMEEIAKYSTLNIPRQYLTNLLCKATCAHAVQGSVAKKSKQDRNEIAKYVVKCCDTYLQKGYSKKDIAILCYRDEEVKAYRGILASEIRKSNSTLSLRNTEEALEEHAILDSIRRFSGLERSIVFGIIPQSFPFHEEILRNILVCVASRATLNLHLLD